MGIRSWEALGGFARGPLIVALFDAVLIGLALLVIGVPLALPLDVLIFFGAFVPVTGATLTGLLAVVVALVSQGITAALLALAAILIVQQLQGNALQPVVVGRAVDVHPIAIVLGVTAGAVLAGIIGAMVAAPPQPDRSPHPSINASIRASRCGEDPRRALWPDLDVAPIR